MMIDRTKFALEELTAHFKGVGRIPLIESFCVQYLVVCLYSEMEKALARIIAERLDSIADPKIASFVAATNDAMIRRVKKAEINDLLKKFGCDELINNEIDGLNLQPYFDAISSRHLVTHGDGCNLTFDEFEKALPCAEAILAKVRHEIS